MSKFCQLCGKGPVTGNTISHSHRKSRRRWLPNLQKATLLDEKGQEKQMKVCTRCLRTYRKKRVSA